MTDAEVAVVGGGLAGLVAARHLAEAGLDVRVFEERETVGGRVRSRRREGFVLDRGFQVLFTGYPAVREELDLDALDLQYFDPGATIARGDARSILADPFREPSAAIETALNPEITTGDKLRTLRLRRDLGSRDLDELNAEDRTVGEYLRERGFSERFVERFAAPFYGGITFDRSLESTSAFVFEYTFAILSRGRIAVPREGMGAISRQLAERARGAGAEIRTGVSIEAVSRASNGAEVEHDGEASAFDAVVVATDPPTAREFTGIESIPTAGRGGVTQHYALPREPALDGEPRLLLNAESGEPNHVAPMSAVAPEYAPAGRSLLSATFLGTRAESAAELAERTRKVLESWYPSRSFGGLEPLATDRISFCQFDQPPGFRASLPASDAPGGRVFLAGEYTRWSSIQGAMASGRDATRAIRAVL